MGTLVVVLITAGFVAFWVIVGAPLWVSIATIAAGTIGIWLGWRAM